MEKTVNHFFIVVTLLLLVAFSGCSSFIEKDLAEKKIVINNPASFQLEEYTQTFWWEKMEGALKYEVQIVSPDFGNLQRFVLDSAVAGNKMVYTLEPGDYEWRIRGVNGSYQSEYSSSKFTIKISDIKKQSVLQLSPGIGNAVSSETTMLTWASLYGVDGYIIEIDKSNTFNSSSLIKQDVGLSTKYPFAPSEETTYYWRVRGYKGADSTKLGAPFYFTFDQTAPEVVELVTPLNNLTASNPVSGNLVWKSQGSNMKYKVYIQYGSGTETASALISGTTYAYTGVANQTVSWRVQAYDAANNAGPISPKWQFKIQ